MRLIHYHIINKYTNEKIFTDCRLPKVQEVFGNLESKEEYKIVFQWKSI